MGPVRSESKPFISALAGGMSHAFRLNESCPSRKGAMVSQRRPNRIIKAITDAMWERDRLQMQMMGALLSTVERLRRRAARPRRHPARRRRETIRHVARR